MDGMSTRTQADGPTVLAGRIQPTAQTPAAEPALGDLFRKLADDSGTLIRQEIALAKSELKESVGTAVSEAVWVPVWGAIALVGALVLVAFLVVGLGAILDNYWLSALIVGLVFAGGGGLMAMMALRKMKTISLAPDATIQTLKQDRAWAKSELDGLKRNLTD
jgi:hypothetical protein